jgi:hypothetical protein
VSTVHIPKQDKAVRFRGIGSLPLRNAGVAGVLALLPLVLACASAARYATGPLPPSALPEPAVRLEMGGPPGQVPAPPARPILHLEAAGTPGRPPSPLPDVDVLGRVRRLVIHPGPAHGFHIEIDVPKGVLLADVLTYSPIRLDLAEGHEVRLRAFLGTPMLLRLDDSQGPLFLVSAGPFTTEIKDVPIEVRAAPRRAYVEVLTTDDLCLWTVLARSIEVTSHGVSLGTVGPGATATFEAQGRRWQVTSSVASSPEESDCGREGSSRLAFFWARVPPTPLLPSAQAAEPSGEGMGFRRKLSPEPKPTRDGQ